MENWITRLVAVICAAGCVALFWTFGMFAAVPWLESRMLSLNMVEMQVLGIPLVVGLIAAWGALHILAMADGESSPKFIWVFRIALLIAAIAAIFGGASWTQGRIA